MGVDVVARFGPIARGVPDRSAHDSRSKVSGAAIERQDDSAVGRRHRWTPAASPM